MRRVAAAFLAGSCASTPPPAPPARRTTLPPGAATYASAPEPRTAAPARALPELDTATADARLDRAAQALAEMSLDGIPSSADVAFVVAHFGVFEPARVVVQRFGADGTEARNQLHERLAAEDLHGTAGVGAAQRDGHEVVVVALGHERIGTPPFPRALALGGTADIDGHIPEGYRDLQVVTLDAAGAHVLALDEEDGFRARFRCATAGTTRVEILASPEGGVPEILADAPISCGVPPPAALEPPPPTLAELEADLLARVNGERARRNLPALLWDRRAAATARLYAEAMRDRQTARRDLADVGSLADRARKGGLVARVLLDNVARADSVNAASVALLAAETAREQLLSDECTHAGVGVAPALSAGSSADAPEIYVAEILFGGEADVSLEEARALILASVARSRAAARLPPLGETDALDQAAQYAAESLAEGKDYDTVQRRAERDAFDPRRRQTSVLAVHATTDDPGDPALGSAGLVPDRSLVGVGVVKLPGTEHWLVAFVFSLQVR